MGRAATGSLCSSPGVSVGETQIQMQRKPGSGTLKGRESWAKTGMHLRGHPTRPRDLTWRSERREVEQFPSVPRAWPVQNARACGQLWPEALSLSALLWGLPAPLGVLALPSLSPEAGWVTSAPCSLLGSLSEGQTYSRWLGTLPCRALSRTGCSVTQGLFSSMLTDSRHAPLGCTNPLMCVGSETLPIPSRLPAGCRKYTK